MRNIMSLCAMFRGAPSQLKVGSDGDTSPLNSLPVQPTQLSFLQI